MYVSEFERVLDVVKLTFGVVLTFYAYHLSKGFKKGIMERSFKLIFASIILFVVAQVGDLGGDLASLESIGADWHDAFEVAFIVVLFFGLRELYIVWRVDDSEVQSKKSR